MKLFLSILFLFIFITLQINSQITPPDDAIAIGSEAFWNNLSNPDKKPIVKGVIINADSIDFKSIPIKYIIVNPFCNRVKKSAKVKPDGTFSLELDYACPYRQIWLHVGNFFYAGIYSNSELLIEFDYKKIMSKDKYVYMIGEGVRYLGQDGEANTYLNKHNIFKRNQQIEIEGKINNLHRQGAITKSDSLFSTLDSIDNEFFQENGDKYAWLIKNERKSQYYRLRSLSKKDKKQLISADYHQVYLSSNYSTGFLTSLNTQIIFSNFGRKMNGFYHTCLELPYFSYEEKETITTLSNFKEKRKAGLPLDTLNESKLYKEHQLLINTCLYITRARMLGNLLDEYYSAPRADFQKIINWYFNRNRNNPNRVKNCYDILNTETAKAFMKTLVDRENQKQFEINKTLSELSQIKSNNTLEKEITEMDFGVKLYSSDTMNAQELLLSLSNKFKGKALIIDCWATWCKPCLIDMPYGKALKPLVKDLPIEFVYLCTSRRTSVDKWKSKIEKLKQAGTHIYVKEDTMNELMEIFSLNRYPSYIFMDLAGNYKPNAINRMKNLDRDKLQKLL